MLKCLELISELVATQLCKSGLSSGSAYPHLHVQKPSRLTSQRQRRGRQAVFACRPRHRPPLTVPGYHDQRRPTHMMVWSGSPMLNDSSCMGISGTKQDVSVQALQNGELVVLRFKRPQELLAGNLRRRCPAPRAPDWLTAYRHLPMPRRISPPLRET